MRAARFTGKVYEGSAKDLAGDASDAWHEAQYTRLKALLKKVESTNLTHKGKADVAPEWDLWSDNETSGSNGSSEASEASEASTEDERGHGRRSVGERMQKFAAANESGEESASDFE